MTLRRGGAEPDIYRRVRVNDDALLLAADAGELLIRLQHRAGLIVIDHERPEVLCRNVGWQVDLICLAAVKRPAFRIGGSGDILRAEADHAQRHRGRDTGGVIDEVNTRIEIAHTWLGEELITAPDKAGEPSTVRIVVGAFL